MIFTPVDSTYYTATLYRWDETTTGFIMTVNGVRRWFLCRDTTHPTRWEIYEIVSEPNSCLLRSFAYSLEMAKHGAYLIECNERNSRYRMTAAE